MSNTPKNILVTGGTGFIGSHLIPVLLSRMDTGMIDVVDNLSSSQAEDKAYIWDKQVRFYKKSVREFCDGKRNTYDQIYHLASPVGPAGVLNYAGRMGPMIVDDSYRMAMVAMEDNARLLDISTSEVYGCEPGEVPQREDIAKVVPSTITVRLEYGVAKLMCEVFLTNLHREHGLHVNFIRPFNIVGTGQNGQSGFVLPRFIEQALKNEPITVFGDGSQQRTFTAVQDIVAGMVMVMNSEADGEIFNVGNPLNVCTIQQLAEMVIRMTDSQSEIIHVDPREIYGPKYAEAWNKIPNVGKLRRTGWAPRITLEEIVREVIDAAVVPGAVA